MKKVCFKIILICLTFAVIFSAAGCSEIPENGDRRTPVITPKPTPRNFIGKITFSSYKTFENDNSNEMFKDNFKMEYPNVEVVIDDDYTMEEYFATLDERVANGTIGDIFVIDDTRVADYAENDYIVDLSPYVENLIEYETFKRLKPHEILYKSAYEASTYMGNMYMVATEYNHKFVFINFDLLKKAGLEVPNDKWTWEEFTRYAEELSKLEEVNIPVVMDYTDRAIWGAFIRGYIEEKNEDGDIFKVNASDRIKTITLTDPEVLKGAQILVDFVKTGLVENKKVTADELKSIGMIVTTKPVFNEWTEKLKSGAFDWDLMHFPTLENRKVGAKSLGLCVSTKSQLLSVEQKDMSVQFVLHALIEEAAVDYSGIGEIVPANKAVNAMKFWREYPVKGKNTSVFSLYTNNDFTSTITHLMNLSAAKEYYKIGDAIVKAFNGIKTLEQSFAEIEDKINELWEQNPVYETTPTPKNLQNTPTVTETAGITSNP